MGVFKIWNLQISQKTRLTVVGKKSYIYKKKLKRLERKLDYNKAKDEYNVCKENLNVTMK